MKKRILSGTLAMAMIIALIASISIPASAMALNGFYVDGKELADGVIYTSKSEGFSGIIKDDGGSITRNGNTITLNNVTINSNSAYSGLGIYNYDNSIINGNVTIDLIGKNTINELKDGSNGINATGKDLFPNLSIESASNSQGSLDITGCNAGINSLRYNLSINNCTLTSVSTSNIGDGIATGNGNLTISNSTVTAVGTEDGIHVKGENITISGSTVTSTGAGDGIFVGDSEKGIGTLNISNSTLTATATDNLGESFGVCSYKGITISNSTVNATGSFGMFSIDGDITAQSGKITAKSSYTGGAAILATGNINLGTGMYIKIGGNIRSNISLGNFIVSTIAEGNVKNDGTSRLAGAAKDVVICGPGTVSVQSPQKPSNISSVTLPSQTDLQNAVLTDDDKKAIANGTNVNIQMVINSVQAPSDADKVQKNLGKNTLGMYLDISILKTVGDTQTAVHNLNAPIRITFTIPDNLKGKSKYYVIRVHDGVTTVLEDLDSDPNTVTFETNQFSTYALVYSAKSARTSDNSNIAALAVMAVSSLAAVAFIEKKKVK